jgi:hypothetical protein
MIVIVNGKIVMFGIFIELESVIGKISLNVFERWQILDNSIFIKTNNTGMKCVVCLILDFKFVVLSLRVF